MNEISKTNTETKSNVFKAFLNIAYLTEKISAFVTVDRLPARVDMLGDLV